jgi:TonB family protein
MIISVYSLFSQDTLFFNKYRIKTIRDSASFYRIFSDTSNYFKIKDYYLTGIPQMIGYSLSKDSIQKLGKFYNYYDNGDLKSVELYTSNNLNGQSVYYYKNGKVKYEINFINNKKNGELKGYYNNGTLRRIDHYKNDTLLEGKCFTSQGKDTTYFIYEKSASYKNGDFQSFRKFVQRKVHFPKEALNKGIQGQIIIQFVVNTKGKIQDIIVIKSPDDLLSKTAVEAVSKSKTWNPGIKEGKKVKQKFAIPINFKLTK